MKPMINIYNPGETEFKSNGNAVLFPTECIVTEEINGAYELKLKHPMDAAGIWKTIQQQAVLKAPTPNGLQPFRIYNTVQKLDNTIEVKARHIFYDNIYNFIEEIELTNVKASDAIQKIFSSTYSDHNFVISCDAEERGDLSLEKVNPVEALMGNSGFLNVFGGELYRDWFNINIVEEMGGNRGFSFRYGHNITGLTVETDMDSVITRLIPIGRNEADNPLYLPEKYIESPRASQYFTPMYGFMDYEDIKTLNGLREQAAQEFKQGIDTPAINVKVDFIMLKQTSNYAKYQMLEELQLGDTVSIFHEGWNMALTTRCTRYTYDACLERFKSVELGNTKEDLAGDMGQLFSSVSILTKNSNVFTREISEIKDKINLT